MKFIPSASLLMSGDWGRLGTQIYADAVETSPRIEARNSLSVYLLWKLCDQGRQGTPSYVDTLETLRHGQARHTHLRSYRGNLKNVCVCILFFRIPQLAWKPE